jgi:hypothetical protein
MEFAHRIQRYFANRASQNSVALLSVEFKRRTETLFKLVRSSALVRTSLMTASCILLGLIAQNTSENRAERKWLETHLPSPTWVAAETARLGFHEINDPSKLGWVLKQFPTHAPIAGLIWTDSSFQWFAWQENSQDDPHFYRIDKAGPPEAWFRIGSGWPAWDLLFQRLQEAEKRRLASLGSRRGSRLENDRDPRELRY